MIPESKNLTTTLRETAPLHWLGSVRIWLVIGWLAAQTFAISRPCAAQATMHIRIGDEKTGEPLAARILLRDAKGKVLKARGAQHSGQWNIVEGSLDYRGKAGDYIFDVYHGPEYASGGGGFTLDKDGEGSDAVRLPRHANMAKENYFASDRLVFAPESTVGKWLAAELLHTTSLCSTSPLDKAKWQTEVSLPEGRWFSSDSFYDDRPTSGLVFHHWTPPAAVPAQLPSTQLLVLAKQQPETRVEIARLWSPDTPLWLASGRIDAIQILSEHLTSDGESAIRVSDMFHPEPGQFKGPRGPGRLVENLYWQVLEAGLQIPPSAGSAFSRSHSPLGYNRVYVQLPETLRGPTQFEESLYAGRSFVTNGPLLRAKVNDQYPGATLQASEGSKLALDVSLQLTVSDPVEYVDVVFNGEAIYHARLDEYAKQGGKIPLLEVEKSGWLVVRVVTSREETYRLATTAPFYIKFDGQGRISKAACQFFLDWIDQTGDMQKSGETYIKAAKKFWEERLAKSNAD